jgi:hypothetical protein
MVASRISYLVLIDRVLDSDSIIGNNIRSLEGSAEYDVIERGRSTPRTSDLTVLDLVPSSESVIVGEMGSTFFGG